MSEFIQKYVNPFTDFGFKKIFGEEPNKDLLIDFLNELLREEQGTIKDLTYLKSDQLGRSDSERSAIFDLYCENDSGEKFIVEIQKSRQKFFKDRTVYYSTFPIQQQGIKKENWNFELTAVYTIAILDFIFDEDKEEANKLLYKVKLSDIETHKVFYDKLTFVYLEMPKFTKTVEELETHFEKWLYLIRNLSLLESIPEKLQEKIFLKVFKVAEIARFTHEQMNEYIDNLKHYRDNYNTMETAKEEAREKGIKEGIKKGRKEGREEGIKEGITKGRKEGKEEGREEGITAGLEIGITGLILQSKLTVQEIAEAFQVEMDVVERIRKKLNK